MIKTELYTIRADGVRLYRTFSDSGKMIRQEQSGVLYSEAIDPEGAGATYTETDIDIGDTGDLTVADCLAALAELGVAT